MSKKKKKQKQKVIYYDDNSTIVDMSATVKKKKGAQQDPPPRSTFKDKLRTYFSAVKMMFLPMCVVLLILAVLFLFLKLMAQ